MSRRFAALPCAQSKFVARMLELARKLTFRDSADESMDLTALVGLPRGARASMMLPSPTTIDDDDFDDDDDDDNAR